MEKQNMNEIQNALQPVDPRAKQHIDALKKAVDFLSKARDAASSVGYRNPHLDEAARWAKGELRDWEDRAAGIKNCAGVAANKFGDPDLVADGEDKLSGGVVRLKKMRDGKFGIFYSGTTAPASAYRTEDEAMAAFRKLAVKIRNCATPTTNSVVANAVARMRAEKE